VNKTIFSFLKLFIGNFGSKLIGFIREILIAYFFGTSVTADAIRLSQHVFFVPLSLLSSEASSSSFIPQFRHYVNKKEYGNANTLFWSICLVFFLFAILFMVISLFFINNIISLFVSNINNELLNETKAILTPMLFGTVFYTMTILFMFRLQAEDRFGIISLRAIIQNVFMIVFMVISYYLSKSWIIGMGFSLSYFFLFLLSIRSYKNSPITINAKNREGDKIALLVNFFDDYKFLVIIVILFQALVFIERYFASSIGQGGISALDYAKFVVETPNFLIGVPVAAIALNHFSGKQLNAEIALLEKIAKIIFIFFLPISFFLIPFSNLIIKIMFFRGEFNHESLYLTESAFKGYILGLWAMIGSMIFQKIFNASFNSRILIKYLLVSFLVVLISNILFTREYGVLGVGFSTSVFYSLYFLLMINRLRIIKKIKKNIILPIIISICVLSLVFFEVNLWVFILFAIAYYLVAIWSSKALIIEFFLIKKVSIRKNQ